MRFKLDECVDVRTARLFEDAGYDAETVFSEKLAGAADKSLYDICLKEKRTFVTQDLDFSNPFVFDPLPTKGIVVLRVAARTQKRSGAQSCRHSGPN